MAWRGEVFSCVVRSTRCGDDGTLLPLSSCCFTSIFTSPSRAAMCAVRRKVASPRALSRIVRQAGGQRRRPAALPAPAFAFTMAFAPLPWASSCPSSLFSLPFPLLLLCHASVERSRDNGPSKWPSGFLGFKSRNRRLGAWSVYGPAVFTRAFRALYP